MNLRKDLFSIFKKHTLELVSTHKDFEDIYTFNFKSTKPIKWMAGQHGIFIINHKKINKPIRPFSVASSPSEDIVKITVKIGEQPSEYKQSLLEMEKGETCVMRGPVGGFYLKDDLPTLFITGGIGITPYRSIIKYLLDNDIKHTNTINMLYIANNDKYVYKNFFDSTTNKLNFEIDYVSEIHDFQNHLTHYCTHHQNNAKYFITGSKSMVKSVESQLKELGIRKKNIIKDTFIGY